MTIGILAAGLGLLLAAAAIVIPRLVNRRNDPEYDADSRAYQKETGRSARDIAQGNADQAFQQENDSGSHQAGGSDGPARPSLSRGLALVRNFGPGYRNVSSKPRRTDSPVISTSGLIGGRIPVGPERLGVNHRSSARQVKIQSDRSCGEAVASVEATGAIVGGVCRYRDALRALLGGPGEECRHELLADAAVAVGWIHVNAFQVCHPDGMHAAGAPDASDQMACYLVVVMREQDQVVAIGEQRRVVRDAVFGCPAEIGGSGVMCSGICCEEGLN